MRNGYPIVLRRTPVPLVNAGLGVGIAVFLGACGQSQESASSKEPASPKAVGAAETSPRSSGAPAAPEASVAPRVEAIEESFAARSAPATDWTSWAPPNPRFPGIQARTKYNQGAKRAWVQFRNLANAAASFKWNAVTSLPSPDRTTRVLGGVVSQDFGCDEADIIAGRVDVNVYGATFDPCGKPDPHPHAVDGPTLESGGWSAWYTPSPFLPDVFARVTYNPVAKSGSVQFRNLSNNFMMVRWWPANAPTSMRTIGLKPGQTTGPQRADDAESYGTSIWSVCVIPYGDCWP